MTDTERLKSILAETEYGYISYDNLHGDDGQGIDLLADLIGHRIEKKVRMRGKGLYICPSCERILGTDRKFETHRMQAYCQHCGQKLDWKLDD